MTTRRADVPCLPAEGPEDTATFDAIDVAAGRRALAALGPALAGLVGTTALSVSGGAEHQGPDGGGPVMIVARAAG